jgi:hypothetical protein
MRVAFRLFLDFMRKPEWVAAIALLIQAIILWLEARILHRHGETMKEHAGIAQSQATTAELIGQALKPNTKRFWLTKPNSCRNSLTSTEKPPYRLRG